MEEDSRVNEGSREGVEELAGLEDGLERRGDKAKGQMKL